MYKIFKKLLEINKVSVYKVSKDTGIPYSALSEWKAGRSTPKADKLQKIADYFHVSMEYLMSGKEHENYSVEEAALFTKVLKDQQSLRIMKYFMALNKTEKDEIENMIAYKINKKEEK